MKFKVKDSLLVISIMLLLLLLSQGAMFIIKGEEPTNLDLMVFILTGFATTIGLILSNGKD